MEIRDLKYFLACVELGSLQLAAQRVARTQPALTKSIRRLEGELGTRLFEKDGRGLRPTATGVTLEAHARKLLQSIGEAVREVTEVAEGHVGHVRLGTCRTMAEGLLPKVIEDIQRQAPGLTFEIKIGIDQELRTYLHEGLLDFIITPMREGDAQDYNAVSVGRDTMVVASRPGHPLLGREVTCSELAQYRWMLPALTSQRWIQAAFARHAIAPPDVQMEVNSVLALRRTVVRTDLLTFVSRMDLYNGGDAVLEEVLVPELRLERQFGLLSPREGHVTTAAQRVLGIIASKRPNV